MTAGPDGTGDTPDDGDRTPEDDLAERWNQIIAELGDLDLTADLSSPSDRPDQAEPADPGTGHDPSAGAPGPGVTYPVAPWVVARPEERARPEPTGRDWDGTDQIDAAESEMDDREHFVPPDPGPVFGGDPLLTMAWLGAAGIPIALLVVVIAWRSAPTALLQAAGVVFALCCMLLVWRLPHRRDESDDDPGAVV